MLPDKETLARFVDAVFRHCDKNTYVIFKAYDKNNKTVFPADGCLLSHPKFVDFAYNRAKQAALSKYSAVFCPSLSVFIDSFTKKGRWSATLADLSEGPCLSVELDTCPDAGATRGVELLGLPTVTVASGGLWTDLETGEIQDKLHLHWRLRIPTRDLEGHRKLHEARWLAAKLCGGG